MPKQKQPSLIIDGVIKYLRKAADELDGMNANVPAPAPTKKDPNPHMREGIVIFTAAYHDRFGRAPYLTMPDKGVLAKLHRELPDFTTVVEAYLGMQDPWYQEKGFPARLLPSAMDKIRVDLEGGARKKSTNGGWG